MSRVISNMWNHIKFDIIFDLDINMWNLQRMPRLRLVRGSGLRLAYSTFLPFGGARQILQKKLLKFLMTSGRIGAD